MSDVTKNKIINNITPSDAGNYSCEVTHEFMGSKKSPDAEVIVNCKITFL